MCITLGSLFDGSGGFPLAGSMCGFKPLWASEVEPYPIAVTRSRFPDMQHLGDISKIDGGKIPPVDIITFGSPCQDLSVAGKRAGLKHEGNGDDETTRSGLFMEAVRIIKEMRKATNGDYPRFALWENVPGAFSSNKGEDFRVVLEELIKITEPNAVMPDVPKKGWAYADSFSGDGWSLAYRVFDTQYWPRTPQRRKRIYLAADFGGQCAREILFEREGLRGDYAKSRAPWEEATTGTRESTGADYQPVTYGVVTKGNGECFLSEERHTSLSTGGGQAEQGYPCVMQPVCFGISSFASNGMLSDNPHVGFYEAETSRTLDLNGGNPACHQGGICVVEPVEQPIEVATQQGGTEITGNGVCPTITAAAGMSGNNQPWICWPEKAQTLSARHDGSPQPDKGSGANIVVQASGFKANQGAKAGGVGWQEEKACTLNANLPGLEPSVCVKEVVCSIDGDKVGKAERSGGSGLGIRPGDKMYTLTAKDVHGTCVAEALPFDTTQVTSPQNGCNPKWCDPCHPLAAQGHPPAVVCKTYDARGNGNGDICCTITGDHNGHISDYTALICTATQQGIAENIGNDQPGLCATQYLASGKDASGTLMASMATKQCLGDQEAFSGDYHIIEEHKTFQNTGQGWWNDEDIAATLRTPCGGDSTKANVVVENQCAGVDCRNMNEYPELYPTLQAKPNGGQSLNFSGAVRVRYIVRRLTPTECGRLQGFPDRWGDIDPKEDFTDEEYRFWLEVRNTHAAINGRTVKEYTQKQMLTWYNKLGTDSAEYKMWGNGLALPPTLYIMQGIQDALEVDYDSAA